MRFANLTLKLLEVSIGLLIVLMSFAANASVDDLDEEEPSAIVAGAVPVANSRYEYDGRRDEQLLEVQASLPVPVRSSDGSVSIRLPSDDSDASHD